MLLADRGYFQWNYLNRLDDNGALFVMRAYTTINPQVVQTFDGQGRRRPRLEEQSLKALRHTPQRILDLDVYRTQRQQSVVLRLMVSWNPDREAPCFIVTHMDRSRYSADTVVRLVQLRWQIELLFKETKSYAQLRAFRTANPYIAECLIWAAVAAATIQRFTAHLTQRVHAVEISTQKTAKAASAALTDLYKALAIDRTPCIQKAFKAALNYLATNAQRAHPRRDRQSGRLQAGLKSVGVAA
ncbi:MAG: transposase [Salinisphaera sp.]|nr:transposase [Salinisphaera sp.]